MKTFFATVIAVTGVCLTIAVCGCGGGGGETRVVTSGTSGSLSQGDNTLTRTGTVRFNLFNDSQIQLQADDGTIYSPINAPDNAKEGEKVRFTFVPTQPPAFVQPHGVPILLTDFRPV